MTTEALSKDQQIELMRSWARSRRITILPGLVPARTQLEMRRGAEKTGGPDPFDPDGTTVVYIGHEEFEERTGDFPSELLVARVALALNARQDEQKGE